MVFVLALLLCKLRYSYTRISLYPVCLLGYCTHEAVLCVRFYGPQMKGPWETLQKLKTIPARTTITTLQALMPDPYIKTCVPMSQSCVWSWPHNERVLKIPPKPEKSLILTLGGPKTEKTRKLGCSDSNKNIHQKRGLSFRGFSVLRVLCEPSSVFFVDFSESVRLRASKFHTYHSLMGMRILVNGLSLCDREWKPSNTTTWGFFGALSTRYFRNSVFNSLSLLSRSMYCYDHI